MGFTGTRRMKLPSWLSRVSPKDSKAEPPKPEIIQLGVVKSGGNLVLCVPESPRRGVRLVSASSDFILRYNRNMWEFRELQRELSELPSSLRLRKRSRRAPKTEKAAE